MNSRRIKRIFNEIKELKDSVELFENSGLHYYFNEENINNIYIMIIGSKDTPYENGYYFFKLEYPEQYPMIPPKMTYCTQGILLSQMKNKYSNDISNCFYVRFNPNLYTNGKVCLSMLNTWAGPGWVPTNTITNILVAIQAIVLNEEPLKNEPGYENSCDSDINKYNLIIQYANCKIAILDQLKSANLGDFECFREKIKSLFLKNVDNIIDNIEIFNKIDNDIIQSPIYGMNFKIEYTNLLNYYKIIRCKLLLNKL
tara:strand:+ start:1525 stop:2292 length:768 start_codon:yes stop_codon:yes gene_type:complete